MPPDSEALSKPAQEAIPLLPIPVAAKARADPKLSRTIAVAGWIAEPDDFVDLWRGLSSKDSERFSLVWETKELMELNNSIMDMLLSKVGRCLRTVTVHTLAKLVHVRSPKGCN